MDSSRKYLNLICDVCNAEYMQQERVFKKSKWKNRCKEHRKKTKDDYRCPCCNKTIYRASKKCVVCAAKDRMHPDKYCIDCGIKINYRSTRCKTCYDILQDKGKSKERTKFNNSPEWKNARRSVYERDNYTCVVCNRTGGKLECHHVIRYADDKSKRLDVNNLITVCYDCHKYIHFGDHIGA